MAAVVSRFEPVAVVGIGAVLPDADGVREFWENALAGKSAITRRGQRGDDPADDATFDRPCTALGGFVTSEFATREARSIAPELSGVLDRAQAFALAAAREAIGDASLSLVGDQDVRASVVIGNAIGGTRSIANNFATDMRDLHARLMRTPAWEMFSLKERVLVTEAVDELIQRRGTRSSARRWQGWGESGGMIARSVGTLVGATGPCISVDAACASGLAALDVACSWLRSGEADIVVTGACDSTMDT